MKFKGRELEEANFWLRIAVWMAIFSIVARVLAWLLSSGFTAAGLRIMAVVGGGMAACLGLAIFSNQNAAGVGARVCDRDARLHPRRSGHRPRIDRDGDWYQELVTEKAPMPTYEYEVIQEDGSAGGTVRGGPEDGGPAADNPSGDRGAGPPGRQRAVCYDQILATRDGKGTE